MLGIGCLTSCMSKITEDTVNAFFARVQFLFNFATEKFVVIRDWRLGLILRVLQVAIFIYVLSDIINQASYLLQEVPKGVVSPGADVTGRLRRNNIRDQQKKYKADVLPYCVNGGADYEYEYNDVRYGDFQCLVMDPLSIPEQGESKYFITTYLRLDKIYFVNLPSGDDCPAEDFIRDDAERIGKFFDVCVYNTIDQYFPIGPEEIPLSILHSFYTSVVGKSGALPQTVVYAADDFDGGKLYFDGGEAMNLDMADLLRIAGVDLDRRLDDQPNPSTLPAASKDSGAAEFPFARLSGVNLIMNFKYFQRSLAPDAYKKAVGTKAGDVICLVEVTPQYTWSVQGADVRLQMNTASDPFFIDPERERLPAGESPVTEGVQVDFQRNGVQLTFQVSGNLGEFSFFSLIDALVAGAVMLGVAQLIVTYVALYALGLSSMLYTEYMRESVDWRKEYARFAAQSLVAGSTFMNYDTNHSGKLDRTEIYEYLSDILKDTLKPPQVACLTDFLMRHGEMDAEVSKGRLDDVTDVKISTINMAEWLDIFTEEKVRINSLTRLVDSEYSDPKIIEILLKLAEGRHVRGLSHLMSGDVARLESEPQAETRLLDEGVSTGPSAPVKPEEGASQKTGDDDDM